MRNNAQQPAPPPPPPPRAAQQARADAENARLDAQIELAAKKRALQELQQQVAQGEAQAPAQGDATPAAGTITYTGKDGQPITITSPTAEQLEKLGIGTTQAQAPVEGWQLVAMTGTVVWGAVALMGLYLWHRRKTRGVATTPAPQTEARMARIENAIESVAEQMERVSEAQRYQSKLLSEGAAQPIVAGGRAPMPASVGDQANG
jgi:hypothetical protein